MIMFDNKLFVCLMLQFKVFPQSLHLVASVVMKDFTSELLQLNKFLKFRHL
jgi:hypothetical protein